MHLTFWQPIPSPHQRGLLEALASAPWVKSVRLRYESPLSDERRAQGWEDAEFVGVDVARITPGEVPRSGADQVNIFTGFNTYLGVWAVFKRIPTRAPGLCLAYAEAPELYGLWGFRRKIKYRVHAWRLGNRLDAVLALGELGARFYKGLLGARVPVTEFGYYDRSERDRVVQPDPDANTKNSDKGSGSEQSQVSYPPASGLSSQGSSLPRQASGVPPDSPALSPQVPESQFGTESPPPVTGLNLFADTNLVINGLDLQSGSLSLPLSSNRSPGFTYKLPERDQVPTATSSVIRSEGARISSASRHPAPMLGKIGALQPNTRRLLYVGECILRKGLDQLLIALANLPPSAPPWILDVVGTGSEGHVFMKLSEQLDLVDRVRFRNLVKGDALDQFYLRAALVIVPSRWDGWSMAVNEALFAGIPVAVTDRCGASSVIKNLPRCMVLPANRIKEWPELLIEWLEWGTPTPSDRARLQKAAESLTGEVGAEELKTVIEKLRRS